MTAGLSSSAMPTLICDFGGVLFAQADLQRRVEAWWSANSGVLGVQSGEQLRDDLLRGFEAGTVGEVEYALHLRARLGWTGSDEQLTRIWADAHGPVNLDVLEALGQLRERGWKLLGAADDTPWDERARAEHFGSAVALFDRVVTGCQVGARRPDPRFFAGLRAACGQGQRLYVDDDPHNVAAARRAGLDAHLFTTVEDLIAACRRLVVAVG
jgi:FMN phosphatase YigB (HAD superfamily)